MQYEVVNLKEKMVVGLAARTNNSSPNMSEVIGTLWQDFYSAGCYDKINGRSNDKALGIYTDYAGNETDDYTVMAACEVENTDNIPDGVKTMIIPGGKYAKFVVRGHMVKAVYDFWQKLWQMDLNRAFVCDFEEYQNADIDNAEIHIYISLK